MSDPLLQLKEDIARVRFAQMAVAYAFDVPVHEVGAPTRHTREAAFARQAAMYLAHVAFEMPLSRVAQAFGRDRSTASHACHRIEDRRDDRDFDSYMDALEAALRALPPQPGLLERTPARLEARVA